MLLEFRTDILFTQQEKISVLDGGGFSFDRFILPSSNTAK
jgi:hypothetical protein